jgi:hypothetical protein
VSVFRVELSHAAAPFSGMAQLGHPRPEFGHGQRSGFGWPGPPENRLTPPPTRAPAAQGPVGQRDPLAELSGAAARTTLPEPLEGDEHFWMRGIIVFF